MRAGQSAWGSARPDLRLVPPLDECAPVLDLAVGDVVVYASHGIGCVEARLGGRDDLREVVVLTFQSGLKVTLPVARARGALRAPSGEVELEDVRRTLRADPTPRIEPWARRFRSMRDKVVAGEVTGLAEVVRDAVGRERQLVVGSNTRGAGASSSEHGLYLRARSLLAAEIAFARGIDAAEANVWIVEQIDEQPHE
jgi:RNA polymerase-interacting CarD/CdnL/TRCF family regulator